MPIDPRAGPPPGMSMQGPPPSMHERPPAHMPPMARDDMMMRKDPGAPPGISMVAPGGLMDRQPPGNLMAQRPPQTTQPPPVSTHTPSGMQGLMNLTSMPQVRTLDTCTFFPAFPFPLAYECMYVCVHVDALGCANELLAPTSAHAFLFSSTTSLCTCDLFLVSLFLTYVYITPYACMHAFIHACHVHAFNCANKPHSGGRELVCPLCAYA